MLPVGSLHIPELLFALLVELLALLLLLVLCRAQRFYLFGAPAQSLGCAFLFGQELGLSFLSLFSLAKVKIFYIQFLNNNIKIILINLDKYIFKIVLKINLKIYYVK